MGFRIQNNIVALGAHKNLGLADSVMARSMERLSSGFRINRAADDTAGLSISQAFRADIASTKVAMRNISEGNAMLQVAEGALDQVGTMLTRMKELATQAASASAEGNLPKINTEYNKLMQEVDRIVNSTKYGGTKLLDGTLGASVAGPATAGPITYDGTNAGTEFYYTGTVSVERCVGFYDDTLTLSDPTILEGAWTLQTNGAKVELYNPLGVKVDEATPTSNNDLVFSTAGVTITNVHSRTAADLNGWGFSVEKTGYAGLDVSAATAGTYKLTGSFMFEEYTLSDGTDSQTISFLSSNTAGTYNFTTFGISLTVDTEDDNMDMHGLSFTVTAGAPGAAGADFQVGNQGDTANRISVSISSAKTTAIGTGAGPASLSATAVDTASNAQTAMAVLDLAIRDISTLRGNIGADQNRFTYAAASMATTVENITAAESVIRDSDMASEMTSLSKNQILVQAGTAMLAQANSAPQQLLSLFS